MQDESNQGAAALEDREGGREKRDLTVTIHDEDAGGKPIKVEAAPSATVATVIEKMYDHLHSEHQEGDRLRCEATGDDVFGHVAEHLGDYAESSCEKLEWLFARKTGGA